MGRNSAGSVFDQSEARTRTSPFYNEMYATRSASKVYICVLVWMCFHSHWLQANLHLSGLMQWLYIEMFKKALSSDSDIFITEINGSSL